MRKPKVMPLRTSNAIWAWMQRHSLPNSYFDEAVTWNEEQGVYIFWHGERGHSCDKEGNLI